jgi:hypothetical protein
VPKSKLPSYPDVHTICQLQHGMPKGRDRIPNRTAAPGGCNSGLGQHGCKEFLDTLGLWDLGLLPEFMLILCIRRRDHITTKLIAD